MLRYILIIIFLQTVNALNVATFNIRVNVDGPPNDWPSRKVRVARVLLDHDIDIVGVQEVQYDTLNDLLSLMPGYCTVPFCGVDNAIIYKCGITLLDSGNWAMSDNPAFGSNTWGLAYPRTLTMGKFQTSAGVVYVYNTHIDIDASKQQKQADFIQQHMQKTYNDDGTVLVIGDFNADHGSEFVKSMETFTFVDTYTMTGDDGTFGGGFTRPAGPKIDFILATPCANIKTAQIIRQQVDGYWPSDHAMVFTKIVRTS